MGQTFKPTRQSRSLPTQRASRSAPLVMRRSIPASGALLRREAGRCACGGSCPRCQARSALSIGSSDNAHEREADAVADRVMRVPIGGTSPIAPVARGDGPGAPSSVVATLRSPGRMLDPGTRAFFEPRFGHDFSAVRVHADAAAERSTRDVSALAYTVGNDIVFGAGHFAPGTHEGRRLIAHELTHVVQQSRAPAVVQRRVRPENVSCRESGLTGPDLSGDEVVAAIEAADAGAIALAQLAEDQLTTHLAAARAGDPVDAAFDATLQQELGLTLANPAQFSLIQQQINRFRRVRETLESGYLRYLCRGGTVKLVGCEVGTCGSNFAFTCPGNRLVVLCQAFWDQPAERPGTLLHEPLHIWFHMARHATNALRRADASCFEAFARRLAGETPPFSCAGHTAG